MRVPLLSRLLLLSLALSLGGAPAVGVRPSALALRTAQATASFSLTKEGLLRLRARVDGTLSAPPPTRLDLAAGEPLLAVPGFPDLEGGGYRIHPTGPTEFTVNPPQGKPFQLSLEQSGDVLALRITSPATAFHGFGQVLKTLDAREESLELYHEPRYGDQTYLHLPFFFSDQGLAVAFNAAGRDQVDISKGREARLSTTTGLLDLYVWSEPDPAALVARWYRLSGAQSLLPRWAYGFLQSRYGYRNDAEVRATVGRFRREGLPLSGLVLDLYWFKRMGDLAWDREAFPDPAGLAAWLRGQGVHLVTISEPFFTRDSQTFGPLKEAKGLARNDQGEPVLWQDWWDFNKGLGGSVVDPLVPGAARILQDRYAKLAAEGVDGFWIDLGEPERVPAEARFGPYSERAFHNSFNLEWARLVRKGFEAGRPGQRPFLLSRSGTVGIAGLGVSTWSGDVPSSWKGLQEQLPLGLSASLSGLPFWGSDVGGFITRGGALPDPELFLRWHQFGAFTPVYRAHGAGAREPWIHGDAVQAQVKAVLERRQLLLPYIYSSAFQVWSEGRPMMRPLFFLDPADPSLRGYASAFLFGDSILVAPVTRPLSQGAIQTLRLPKGGWYDAFTLERLEGGRELQVPLSLDRFPLFYREGAILPVDLGAGQEGLILLPGPSPTTFTVFSDDGETEAYRQGTGERLLVSLDARGLNLSGASRTRNLVLLLPKALRVDSKVLTPAGADPLFQRFSLHLRPGAQRVDFRP